MFGNNKILPPIFNDGQILEITSIFPTLQGEGIYVGMPAIFVRLSGCNLACKFCDTNFDNVATLPLSEILLQIHQFAKNNNDKRSCNLVVITGGEPFRQNIAPLCEALLADGFLVQIETNGTLYRELPLGVDIICSPKNSSGNYAPIREDLLERITALKFIISAHDEKYHNVPEIGQTAHNIPVFVQPMDEGSNINNTANTTRAIELAMQNNYRLSLQTHKILGIE